MRMMNAKMPTESPREGGRNNNNNKMGRLSGLIRPKKMSKGSMGGGEGDTMTYCNTVVHQMVIFQNFIEHLNSFCSRISDFFGSKFYCGDWSKYKIEDPRIMDRLIQVPH